MENTQKNSIFKMKIQCYFCFTALIRHLYQVFMLLLSIIAC